MCVGLVAMMSAHAAEKAEKPNLGVSEKVSAIDAYVSECGKEYFLLPTQRTIALSR